MDAEDILSRRDFLMRAALLTSGSLFVDVDALAALPRSVAYKGGKLIGTVPFVGEVQVEPGKLWGSGLDARMYTDLSSINAQSLVTPADKFYIRTACPDQIDYSKPWTIKVTSGANETQSVAIEKLHAIATDMGIHLMECAGNEKNGQFGLMSACRWSGVPVARLFKVLKLNTRGKRVCISGFDKHSQPSSGIDVRKSIPGASWIFTMEQLEAAGAFFATKMNGAPLLKDHGFPVRLMVPGWYGCTCIKWVDEISLVNEDAEASSQMKEFADRTHQNGVPNLAREYKPAAIEQAVMPIRVEKWQVGREEKYNIVGVLWGGHKLTKSLEIRFGVDEPYVPVESYHQTSNSTWTLWSQKWTPKYAGIHTIQLKIADATISTKRLDAGYYARSVEIVRI